MIEADAAIRANISNTLMAMSADPTQDPGVFLLLCKFRRAAFQQSTVGGCGSQAATPAARAAGAAAEEPSEQSSVLSGVDASARWRRWRGY